MIKRLMLLILSLLLNSELMAQPQFSVSPPRQELYLTPSEVQTFIFEVRNEGDSLQHIKIYPSDWSMTKEGELLFFSPGEMEKSCYDWLYINPIEFDINPNESKEIRVSITVPEDVFGEYKTMLFFESTPFDINPNDMLVFSTRIGCAIYAIILNTVSLDGEINNIIYDNKEQEIIIDYNNTGNMHQRINIKLFILRNGKIIYENSRIEQLVLSNNSRFFYFPIETYLIKGHYEIKVLIDYDGNNILEGIKNITVK